MIDQTYLKVQQLRRELSDSGLTEAVALLDKHFPMSVHDTVMITRKRGETKFYLMSMTTRSRWTKLPALAYQCSRVVADRMIEQLSNESGHDVARDVVTLETVNLETITH